MGRVEFIRLFLFTPARFCLHSALHQDLIGFASKARQWLRKRSGHIMGTRRQVFSGTFTCSLTHPNSSKVSNDWRLYLRTGEPVSYNQIRFQNHVRQILMQVIQGIRHSALNGPCIIGMLAYARTETWEMLLGKMLVHSNLKLRFAW